MRWRSFRAVLLAPTLVAVAMVSALTSGSVQAARPNAPVPPANMGIPASLDYSNICPGDSPSAAQAALNSGGLDNRNPAGDAAYVTSTKGNDHCTKISINGGPRAYFNNTAHGGDLVTVYGVGKWQPNQNVQIYLSDGFVRSTTLPHKWPATNEIIGPDKDINRECRTVLKGNLANPVRTFATPETNGGDLLSFEPQLFVVPNVTETTVFNIRVSVPNAFCNIAPGAPAESQATDTLLVVQPFVPSCTAVGNGAACLNVSPQVLYPGQPFTVSAQNLGKAAPLTVNVGVPESSVCVAVGQLNQTASFSGTFTAPPYANLPLVSPQNGVYHYKVYASGAGGCTSTTSQDLYVSPPSLTIPTQLTSGDKATFKGTSWQGGAPNSSTPQALEIVAYVGSQSSFNCAKAATLNGGTPSDGSFALNYTAPDVNNALNDTVRVGAFPAGASLASACQSFDDPACQTVSGTASSTCPLITATQPLRIVPKAAPSVPWQVILLSLLLFLPLLPLFFFLGRRDEDEIIVTEQDITVAREVLDATGSQRVGEATFARTIKVTRERVRLRDGKVLSEEVEEYDVYRDAQGREVRRLRSPAQAGAAQQGTPSPATA
ncbi:MAG: hypothetical protein H0X24_25470 [Ktedonobacterales bacterium]|nr:hypothetical protein [Ktedonobacterales bacterium]